jgi:formamidopyrimidine-DNA glycosylase
MPELPEVESARRRAEAALSGHLIVEVSAVPDRIVFAGVSAARFSASLRGRRVLKVHRKGKQLWMQLDERPFPLFHFGMTGSFQIYRNAVDRPRFWKVELVMDDGVRLAMPDARRFGRIRLQDEPEHEAPLKDLGADPLLSPLSVVQTADLLRRRHAPVKAALLDQRLFAGVGNWIADEVLYQARIRPHRPASSLSPAEVRRLRSCLLSILRRAVAVDADSDRFPRSWLFHHRWGKNSLARTSRGEKITHHTIGGRTTAWVAKRQR